MSLFQAICGFVKSSSRRQTRSPLGVAENLEARQVLTVTYHGGALLQHVEVQGVYYGSDWYTNSTLRQQAVATDSYLKYIVNSSYMDMLDTAGYGVGRGTSSTGVIGMDNINKSYYLTDTQIRQKLQSYITNKSVETPDANRLYVVYVEPGVAIKMGSYTSQKNFLGYHGAFAGVDATGKAVDIRYAVIAYPGGVNPTSSSQGFFKDFDQLTEVTSHELAEAVTDPDVNYKKLGWYDDNLNGEIGDIVNGQKVVLDGFVVQKEVNKADQAISPTGATAYTRTLAMVNNVVTNAGGHSLRFSTPETTSNDPEEGTHTKLQRGHGVRHHVHEGEEADEGDMETPLSETHNHRHKTVPGLPPSTLDAYFAAGQ